MVQQCRHILRHALHRRRTIRRIALTKATQVRRDHATRSTQRSNLFVPQSTVKWIAVNQHDRTSRARIRVGHLKVVYLNVRHFRQKSRFAARATTEISSVNSTGLARYIWNPADSSRSRSSSLAYAVIATAGMLSDAPFSSSRTFSIKPYPSSSGIAMSETSTSGRFREIAWIASNAEETAVTLA